MVVVLVVSPKAGAGAHLYEITKTAAAHILRLRSKHISCRDLVLSCAALSNCAALRLVTLLWLATRCKA
eukprot:9403551-Ditylum_brightwellii.AAC.1